MAAPKTGWGLVALVVLGSAAILLLQWQRTQQLRTELAINALDLRETARLRQQREELRRQRVPEKEVQVLREDREALVRLRTEVEALKASAEKAARTPPPAPAPQPVPVPPLVPATAWKNAGRATPEAAIQTALWAARSGDLDILAASIGFEVGAREKAEAILRQLPPEASAQYPTPEKLVALLTARDIPTDGAMRIAGGGERKGENASLMVTFEPEPSPGQTRRVVNKMLMLQLRRETSDWKLVIPAAAVEKYGAFLLH